MSIITNPVEQFFDLDGSPLDNGYLYFGEPGGNPETQPIQVYWDSLFTIPAVQPIRTMNGYPVMPANSGTPAIIYAVNDVSMTVRNNKKINVFYSDSSGFNDATSNIIQRDSNTPLNSSDNGKTVFATGTFTQTFDPASVLGEGWSINYVNIGTGVITLDPNLTETIDGLSTEDLGRNKSCFIRSDSIGFTTTMDDYRSSTIASAASIDIRNVPSKVFSLTGNASISSVVLKDGQVKKAIVTGTPTLIASANLVFTNYPTGPDYVCTANDILTFSKINDSVTHVEINRITTEYLAGIIFAYPGDTPPPGAAAVPLVPTNVSRTGTYSRYFARFGTKWGSGDGSTTVGIPYLQADGTWLNASGNVGTSTAGQVIAHTHTTNGFTNSGGGVTGGYVGNTGQTGVVANSTGGPSNIAAGSRGLWCMWL